MSKRFYHRNVSDLYEIKVKDYGYKSRAPVSVIVSGTTLGEDTNAFGEPCYYYYCEDAYSMTEGITIAEDLVSRLILECNGTRFTNPQL